MTETSATIWRKSVFFYGQRLCAELRMLLGLLVLLKVILPIAQATAQQSFDSYAELVAKRHEREGAAGAQVEEAFDILLKSRPDSDAAINTILAPALARYVAERHSRTGGPSERHSKTAFERLIRLRPASDEAMRAILIPELMNEIRKASQRADSTSIQRGIRLVRMVGQMGKAASNVEGQLFDAADRTRDDEFKKEIYSAIRQTRREFVEGTIVEIDRSRRQFVLVAGRNSWTLEFTRETQGLNHVSHQSLVIVEFDREERIALAIRRAELFSNPRP